MYSGRTLLVVLLVLSAANAEFILERVEVRISDIQHDGSVKVTENIKMIITGEHSSSLYDSGYSGYYNNDLSFWSTTTELKDVKQHLNPSCVQIKDFRLKPQPRGKCNPVQDLCHGELILEYAALPSYNRSGDTQVAIPGTGVFTIEEYKPRTKRYMLNPEALYFTTTEQGNIILGERVYFIIDLPQDAVVYDVNPLPRDVELELPSKVGELSWNDMILVKFSLVFDVEESLQEEVSNFFIELASGIDTLIRGEYGFAVMIITVILIGGYLYINMAKRKKEE
jgi:hypothetical protein